VDVSRPGVGAVLMSVRWRAGCVGWVERSETHPLTQRRWVSLRSTIPEDL
jgi:hypothetical protein